MYKFDKADHSNHNDSGSSCFEHLKAVKLDSVNAQPMSKRSFQAPLWACICVVPMLSVVPHTRIASASEGAVCDGKQCEAKTRIRQRQIEEGSPRHCLAHDHEIAARQEFGQRCIARLCTQLSWCN